MGKMPKKVQKGQQKPKNGKKAKISKISEKRLAFLAVIYSMDRSLVPTMVKGGCVLEWKYFFICSFWGLSLAAKIYQCVAYTGSPLRKLKLFLLNPCTSNKVQYGFILSKRKRQFKNVKYSLSSKNNFKTQYIFFR